MKAVLLIGFGGTNMLRYGDAPDPVAGPGDVLVDIHAASANAADYKIRPLESASETAFRPPIVEVVSPGERRHDALEAASGGG